MAPILASAIAPHLIDKIHYLMYRSRSEHKAQQQAAHNNRSQIATRATLQQPRSTSRQSTAAATGPSTASCCRGCHGTREARQRRVRRCRKVLRYTVHFRRVARVRVVAAVKGDSCTVIYRTPCVFVVCRAGVVVALVGPGDSEVVVHVHDSCGR
jgi:hypothetical protein